MPIIQGKPCVKCGSTDRYGRKGNCVPCRRESSAKWRAENPERKRALGAKWRAENRERQRKWYAENKERQLAFNAKWRAENPERQRASVRRRNRRKAAAKKMGISLLGFSNMVKDTTNA